MSEEKSSNGHSNTAKIMRQIGNMSYKDMKNMKEILLTAFADPEVAVFFSEQMGYKTPESLYAFFLSSKTKPRGEAKENVFTAPIQGFVTENSDLLMKVYLGLMKDCDTPNIYQGGGGASVDLELSEPVEIVKATGEKRTDSIFSVSVRFFIKPKDNYNHAEARKKNQEKVGDTSEEINIV
jgi:hypothetical protein